MKLLSYLCFSLAQVAFYFAFRKNMDMKDEQKQGMISFPEEEMDEREQVWYFAEYAAGVCLHYLEGFAQHAEMPEQLRAMRDEAVFALRYVLENEDEYPEVDTSVRVLRGLHSFAVCLPFMNADYIPVDDERYAQANCEIARRILPALKRFAGCTQHPPSYFCRIYPEWKDQCDQWGKTLLQMIGSFECLANPERKCDKEEIRKMGIGLHLFAEYLQEMYN